MCKMNSVIYDHAKISVDNVNFNFYLLKNHIVILDKASMKPR